MQRDVEIESILARLARQPDSLAMHEELRRAALHYKAGGGPPLGALAAMPPMSRDAVRALVHFERCWAYDVGNTDLLIRVARAVDACAKEHPDFNFQPVQQWLEELVRQQLTLGR
jgi:hypothetical protein